MLAAAFVTQGVDIGPFGNAGEFHTRLLAYIDEQLKDPSRERQQAFRQKVHLAAGQQIAPD